MVYLSRIKNVVSKLARRVGRDESGQGMTEYILIVALIAVASVGTVTFFGDNIRTLFQMAGNSMAGETPDTSKLKTSSGDTHKTIKTLNTANDIP
jgi:pilus assembly protein Flp/PilA